MARTIEEIEYKEVCSYLVKLNREHKGTRTLYYCGQTWLYLSEYNDYITDCASKIITLKQFINDKYVWPQLLSKRKW